jgi:hypothetical protein
VDTHLRFEVHSYDPYQFCLQDPPTASSWGTPADISAVVNRYKGLGAWAASRGHAVLMGEAGCFVKALSRADRLLWYKTIGAAQQFLPDSVTICALTPQTFRGRRSVVCSLTPTFPLLSFSFCRGRQRRLEDLQPRGAHVGRGRPVRARDELKGVTSCITYHPASTSTTTSTKPASASTSAPPSHTRKAAAHSVATRATRTGSAAPAARTKK